MPHDQDMNGGAMKAPLVETPEVAGAWKNPNTHAYISRITQREENLFLEEYYSSTDTKIYFDDAEQTEIGYIQYSMQEQLKPIYGYASRTWDDVAIGNRIVTGILKIPIRNVDVLGYGKDLKNPSLNEIITYHGLNREFNTDEYNENQLQQTENKEWIHTSTSGGSAPIPNRPSYENKEPNTDDTDTNYTPETAEDFIYRQKLQELGYDLYNGDSILTFEQQIIEFQDDMRDKGVIIDVGSRGKLTSAVKKAIDDACEKKWASNSKINVSPGTKLYNAPSLLGSIVYVASENATCLVLQNTLNDSLGNIWQRVVLSDSNGECFGFYCVGICDP